MLSSLIGIPRPLANTAGHDSARSHVEDTQTHANTHMQSCTTACPDLIAIATETSACVRCYLGSPCETVHICLSVKQRGSVRKIDTRHTSCYRHGGVGGWCGSMSCSLRFFTSFYPSFLSLCSHLPLSLSLCLSLPGSMRRINMFSICSRAFVLCILISLRWPFNFQRETEEEAERGRRRRSG